MKRHSPLPLILSLVSLSLPAPAQEAGDSTLPLPIDELDATASETIVVTGKAENLLGVAPSASKGQANAEELSQRPTLRRGELLETVPGVTITQHSGGGKANQYFLRGFNLDHGTDFNVSLDGMPINFRTHSHGQGYADLNFLIPEFVGGLDYFKGPYFPALGDLSTAGGAQYRLFQELPQGIASLTVGENDYFRALLGDSITVGSGVLTLGGEFTRENGPWTQADMYERFNGLIRYHTGDADNYFNITGMAYHGDWEATDQIPLRAIKSGRLGRFDGVDNSVGGDTSRYSLSSSWQRQEGNGTTHADAWIGHYDLDLFSNFTYFLNDPVRGDQFEQTESRIFSGLNIWHRQEYDLANRPSKTTFGFQTQHDWIDDIGLHLTEERRRFQTVREDDVYEGSYGFYIDHETQMNDWIRIGGGARADYFRFDVDGDQRANAGSADDTIASPKAHIVFGPWHETELYINAGLGFHSNDARGTTITRDPVTGERVDSVDPLVRTRGAEIGIRTQAIQDLTTTVSLWGLESDSEFVYVGDAGTTEAGPGSSRYGVELASYWRPWDWLTVDAEYSWSHARFDDLPGGENYIPNAIEHTLSGGVSVGRELGLHGSLRGRFFSGAPLEESNTFKSDPSLTVNARVGYRWEQWELAVDVLNVLDREDNDIEYYYDSRLAGEPAGGVSDIHLHPAEPRQVRVSMTYKW